MRMLRFWMTAAVGVFALAAGGCSSTDRKEDTGPTYTYPDSAAFCNGIAQAICSTEFVAACVGNKDSCPINMQKSTCQNQPGDYRPVAADDCVKAYKDGYLDGKLTGTEQANIDKACALVWGGPGGVGAACTSLVDCDLDQKLECIRGKCEVPVKVAAGESCSEDNQVCATGYYCTPADKICGKAPGEGQPCDPVTKPCLEDYLCMSGTCQVKITDGDPCTANSECASKLCVPVPGTGEDAGATASRCGPQRNFSPYDPVCIQAATP